MNIDSLVKPDRNMSVLSVLQELERQSRQVRVAIVGAGATARAIALQLGTPVAGIRLAGIANRTPSHAERALREAGFADWKMVTSAGEADGCISRGQMVISESPDVLIESAGVDLVIEVTGSVDYAAQVALSSFAHGKSVILVNAELDSLIGPILKVKADEAGVVLTHTDGDEPGVAMTLVRYLKTLGLKTVAAGNIKGMVDYYRNPDTQKGFAEQHDQDVRKVTSFADATKLSMETTVLANATGFGVARRGMIGAPCDYVREITNHLPAEPMLSGGIVDYSVGAAPHTGAFVVVHEENPYKKTQLAYYKLGDGPFYVFYTPFHLPHIQIPATIGRAFVHSDPTVAPLAGPSCEVISIAKRDMKAGERLDGIGGYCTYGLIENRIEARKENALPIALSRDCVLLRDMHKDDLISFDDVQMPPMRLRDELWQEQEKRWPCIEATERPGRRKEIA